MVNTSFNYLDKFQYQTAPGQAIADPKGTLDQGGLFDYSAFTTFRYSWNDISLGLNWKYLSSVEDAAYALNPNTPNQGTGSYSLFNFNGNYNYNNYTLRFGINNLFNKDPKNIGGVDPNVDNNASSTSPGHYDTIGRQFYVGLKASF